MTRLFTTFFVLITFQNFGQSDLNYGTIGFTAGLHYSKAQYSEKWQNFSVSDINYTMRTFTQFNHFSGYGALFYQSKRFEFNDPWSFQFLIKAALYQTKNKIQFTELIATSGGQSEGYIDPAGFYPNQISSANNIAPQIEMGVTRKMGRNSFLQFGLGYVFDLAITEDVTWEQPFNSDGWQNISFPNQPGERINQDVFFYLNPYWHVGDRVQLGMDIAAPVFTSNLFEINQSFIPGRHNNFSMRNFFFGVQLGLRLDTSYQGCGSCP